MRKTKLFGWLLGIALCACMVLWMPVSADAADSVETECTHEWVDGTCSACGEACAHTSFDDNGFCTVCDFGQPAVDVDGDGYVDIANAGNLYWFRYAVNIQKNYSLNAELTADIVINENINVSDGRRTWKSIGGSAGYSGIFDGNGHSISGIYSNAGGALFGDVRKGGIIRNVGIIDCYITSILASTGSPAASIAYYIDSTSKVENCYSIGGDITGRYKVGGIVAWCSGTVINCYNTSNVRGYYGADDLGGIVGELSQSGSILNCYSTGKLLCGFGGWARGGIAGDIYTGGKVDNCYYLNTVSGTGIGGINSAGLADPMTAEQFASGEVAYLLGDAFGQTIGTDALPVLGGQKVYKGINCKNETTYSNTELDGEHQWINDFCTVCGTMDITSAVASTTVGGTTTYHLTLDAAIQAVKSCTAEDEAVVKLLKNIALGNSHQTIGSGVFTIDLNGFEISSTMSGGGTLYIWDDGTDVTITDSVGTGKISGVFAAVDSCWSNVTICGGSLIGQKRGVYADRSNVTICGGSISGGDYDIYFSGATVKLTLGEAGVGATFPGGIFIKNTTLENILGVGAAYWLDNKMLVQLDSYTNITGGDVIIKAVCTHENGSKGSYIDNGATHTFSYTCCGSSITEVHNCTNGACICGATPAVSVTICGVTNGYGDLNSAIKAVKDCTATDNAVVTILKDLSDIRLSDISGIFTLNLNGCTVSGMRGRYVFDFEPSADVTITGGTIIPNWSYAIYNYGGSVIIHDVKIVENNDSDGVCVTNGGQLTVGGTTDIAANNYAITASGANVTVNGGKFLGYWCINAKNSSNVTINGGVLSNGGYGSPGYHITLEDAASRVAVTAEDVVFKNNLRVSGTTLNVILGDGLAYWQNGKQITVADGTTEITGGDVVIKAYAAAVYSGWTAIDGDWYYYDAETNEPVTGIVRVPYPTESINGIAYGTNAEDVAYYENKGQTFIDKDTALFVFDENGVFQSDLNGLTGDDRWAVNGCIIWHIGLVRAGEDYYYFLGDAVNGGNMMATGDVHMGRNTTDLDVVLGGVYTFGEDGKLCKYDGIVDLRYYENYRLMLSNGLTKVGEYYIYVRSSGELAVDCEYYVPGNDLGIAPGTYTFDENGFLVEPISSEKNGVYFENGAWYYYENGKVGYNKGMMAYGDGYIYVRSSGKLATGAYYITNVPAELSSLFRVGQKVTFDENGIADAPKHGIVDGYYYQYGAVRYNAGLIQVDGKWIYVRSNGALATGRYWVTNTNGAMEAGYYEFDKNGYMIISEIEDGIVAEGENLYYYLDGKKQFGLGLVMLEDGSYIYVRTGGELAVGSYWITNHNGLLPEGMYEFSQDGTLTIN